MGYGAMLSHFVNLAAALHPVFAHQKRAVVTERRPVQLPLSLGDKSAARLLLE